MYLGILIKYIEKQSVNSNHKYAYFLGVGVAMLFLTLEMALVVVGGSFLSIILIGKWKLLIDFSSMWRVIVTFLITLFIFWAGTILKGAVIKSWLNYAYRIFGDRNAEYERVALLDNWIELINSYPILFSCIFLSLCFSLYQIGKKNLSPLYIVSFLVGLIYAIAMTPFMIHNVYLIPSLGMLIFACGLFLSESNLNEYVKLAISLFVVIMITFNFVKTDLKVQSKRIEEERNAYFSDFEAMEKVAKNDTSDKPILITGTHIVNYYTSIKNTDELNRCSTSEPNFCLRKEYNYINIEDDIENKKYKMIVVLKWMNYSQEKIDFLKEIEYLRTSLFIYDVFYLKED